MTLTHTPFATLSAAPAAVPATWSLATAVGGLLALLSVVAVAVVTVTAAASRSASASAAADAAADDLGDLGEDSMCARKRPRRLSDDSSPVSAVL